MPEQSPFHLSLCPSFRGLTQLVEGRSDFFAELAKSVGYEARTRGGERRSDMCGGGILRKQSLRASLKVQRLLRFTLLGYTNPLTVRSQRAGRAGGARAAPLRSLLGGGAGAESSAAGLRGPQERARHSETARLTVAKREDRALAPEHLRGRGKGLASAFESPIKDLVF